VFPTFATVFLYLFNSCYFMLLFFLSSFNYRLVLDANCVRELRYGLTYLELSKVAFELVVSGFNP